MLSVLNPLNLNETTLLKRIRLKPCNILINPDSKSVAMIAGKERNFHESNFDVSSMLTGIA
jgi:hypothetical protein